MSRDRIVGIGLLILAIGIALWGFSMSGGFSQDRGVFVGSYSDRVVFTYIVLFAYVAAIACAGVGLWALLRRPDRD